MARIIDCPCGHVLRGADDGELFTLACKHVDEDHPEMKRTHDEMRARVAADARDESTDLTPAVHPRNRGHFGRGVRNTEKGIHP